MNHRGIAGVTVALAAALAICCGGESETRIQNRQACEMGSGMSCFHVATMYNYGQNGPIDLGWAMWAYSKSCELGGAESGEDCAAVGSLLDSGEVGPRDAASAVRYWEVGCERGTAWSCKHLAEAFEKGDGVAADPERARAYVAKACEKGDAEACGQLATAATAAGSAPAAAPAAPGGEDLLAEAAKSFESGEHELARALFDRACEAGQLDGCAGAARVWRLGFGGPPDLEKARARLDAIYGEGGRPPTREYVLAVYRNTGASLEGEAIMERMTAMCDAGCGLACNLLGRMWMDGNGGEADAEKGREHWRRSEAMLVKDCDAGDGYACEDVAWIWHSGKGVEADEEKAQSYWKRARDLLARLCDEGDEEACESAHDLWSEERGGRENDGKARAFHAKRAALAEKECEAGGIAQCYEVGFAYLRGFWSLAPDEPKAKGYFHKACDGGYQVGCAMLEQ